MLSRAKDKLNFRPDIPRLKHGRAENLEQFAELFLGQAGFADQGAQRSLGQFAMIRHSETTHGRMAEDDVAAGLVVHFVAELAECPHGIRA